MPETTPRAAIDAFITNARTALQCIAQVEVLSTDTTLGSPNNLQIMPFRRPAGSTLLLRKSGRSPYLELEIKAIYVVREAIGTGLRPSYQAEVTMYMYAVFDLSGRELFAYHWHPEGVSAVRAPHFHASAMPPVLLPERPGSSQSDELALSRVHFPTHKMEFSELVRFLITELGIAPRRADWESVLDGLRR